MNLLVDTLPESVTIANTEYQVNSHFKACLKTILVCENDEFTPQEKQWVLVKNLYPKIPSNIPEALERATWFLNGGKESENDVSGPRLYSFSKDESMIFAAFRQTHGIDLATANLHWWAFLALFMDLGQDTVFCQITALRKRVLTGTATKEEKTAARAMGETFNIPQPDTRTFEEKKREQEFLRMVELAEKKRNGTQYG